MPWVKVDDHFDEHPKMARVGPLGWAMWLAGLAYCNRNLTDGFIPFAVARKLVSWEFLQPHPEDEERELIYNVAVGTGMHGEDVDCAFVIEMLLEAGIWEDAPGGYLVHDFAEYQPSKAEVVAEREANRVRQQRSRESRGMSQRDSQRESHPQSRPRHKAPVPVPVPVPGVDGSEEPSTHNGARAFPDEMGRYGLPHLTGEAQQVIESAVGRPLSTCHGWPATELDRLIEERPAALASIPAALSVTGPHPSWAQFVHALRDIVEPLVKAKPMSDQDRKEAEIAAFVAQANAAAVKGGPA